MKSLYAIGTIILFHSGYLLANELDSINNNAVISEIVDLSDVLLSVQDTVKEVISENDEVGSYAYLELKQEINILYTLYELYPHERNAIEQVLNECYILLSEAIIRDPNHNQLLQDSLQLFAFGNEQQEKISIESLNEWEQPESISDELQSAIRESDTDIVYIPESVYCEVEKNALRVVSYRPSRLLYRSQYLRRSSPKILIIKSEKNSQDPEYKCEAGYQWKLGGKDHGKSSSYFKGEVRDKSGNYAKGKISKEADDDGYTCDVKAGTDSSKKK